MAGRKRTIEPDPSTPEGQCALYLRELLKNWDVKHIAEEVGKDRSTIFNYLAGTTTPADSVRDRIAKAIGLRDYRDLMPTDEFLASLGQLDPKAKRKRR